MISGYEMTEIRSPVLDKPTGPGWYWYQHPPQTMAKCLSCGVETIKFGDKCAACQHDKLILKEEKVDPCVLEVGVLGTDFVALWKGNQVPLDGLPGKWQRIAESSFHATN